MPALAAASPMVLSADVDVRVASPTSCEVTIALRVEGAIEVEHRIESFDAAVVQLEELQGARAVAGPQTIGRTQSVVLRLEHSDYRLRYRSERGRARGERCPIWVPTIPSTGKLGTVRINVRLPDGSRPSGSMPALTWSGPIGTTALAHMPAFVRVPYATPGAPAAWDVSRMMDSLAVTFFVASSLVWLWWRRRRRWA
jgi:hypothetical protein